VHVPALVSVNVAPAFEHDPELEYVTAPPGAVAATVKLLPETAVAGARVVTLML
jgi:hypothetical protein